MYRIIIKHFLLLFILFSFVEVYGQDISCAECPNGGTPVSMSNPVIIGEQSEYTIYTSYWKDCTPPSDVDEVVKVSSIFIPLAQSINTDKEEQINDILANLVGLIMVNKAAGYKARIIMPTCWMISTLGQQEVFQTCNEETCCIEFVRSNCSDGGWTAVSDTGSYLVNDCEPSVTTGESLTCDFNYCIDSEKLKKYFNDKYSIDQIVD